jgi:membrane-bound ClpP family serine protease
VNGVLDEPAVILLCVTLAAALVVVEVALPTLGLAGTTGAVAAVGAGVGIDRADARWWPLLGSVVAVLLWSFLVVNRRRHVRAEIVAVAAYAAGSAGFAIVNSDPAAFAVAVVCTAALAVAFPPLHDGAARLLTAQAQVGMESLVGRTARVDRWEDRTGVVLIQGTRWNARSSLPISLGSGDEVTVLGSHGNTVEIAPGPGAIHPPQPPTMEEHQ